MGMDQQSAGRELPTLDGSGIRVAVVCGRFNDEITQRLLDGALTALSDVGVSEADVAVEWVPGAFEVPYAAKVMLESKKFDAVVGLGCVIRGDTSHYDFVAGECARGLQDVALAIGKPVIFGVLTTEDRDQALARSESGSGHNVGAEGARTAVEMVQLSRAYAPGR